ncbi:MAG: hypothetical protein AUF79_19895 [Crenarchaeota archaeon 13_1_20CM_2_51_8]|nr:MAG: hypothetical protein AUF79_19895 [Crenarchaeota archaeon 13_1_20CM_2_51_8]
MRQEMLSPELEAKALLGKSISDVYGRSLGRIIGVNRNQFGEMEGLEVESPGGNVIDIPSKSIMLTPKMVTATPEWKVDAHELTSEIATVKRRIVALEGLRGKGDVDREIYEELLEAQRSGYLSKVKQTEALVGALRARLERTNNQLTSLTKHLVNAKLDYQSGEIDEASMKLAVGSIEPSLKPLIAEKNDLSGTLKTLEDLLPAHVRAS